MTSRIIGLAVSIGALLFATAAEAQVETVVVTGSYSAPEAPGVYVLKRADHLITTVTVTCDTRDAKQRREELKATLRNMMHAASGSISLGVGDKTIARLDENEFDALIEADSRPDTSRAEIVVKTTVSPTETFESARARILDFIRAVSPVGRSEVHRSGDFQLTLIAAEQYRDSILAKILEDAKRLSGQLGPGYGVSIEGLERQVAWYQKGPLDLALYIPYSLRIAPEGAK